MCDPTTIAVIALGASAAGAGIGAIGAMNQGKAQSNALMYQAQVAENNAQIARNNAQLVTQSGEQQTANEGQKTRADVGAIKASQAASNIDVNTGSAVDVRSSAAELGQLNALTIRSNTAREAYGYEVAATGQQATAALDTAGAANAVRAGTTNAISSLLGGASSTAGMALELNRAGAGLF